MRYPNIYVTVSLCDLEMLADKIADIDDRKRSPSVEIIGDMHNLVIKMAGEHASKLYDNDGESEQAAL